MSVREAITDLSSFLHAAPPIWRVPKTTQISVDLSRRAAMVRGPLPHTDFAQLYQRFLRATETNDWSQLDSVDWNDITYLLWTRKPHLLSFNKFQINYRRFLEGSKTARPIKRLIYSYLESYDPAIPDMEWAGALIRKILVQKRYYILEYWRNLELEFQIFSTSPGPQFFATSCLNHAESVFTLQNNLGLIDELGKGGYARQTYLSAIQIIAKSKFQSESDLSRLQHFIEWTISDTGKPFMRFPELQPQTFASLLPAQLPSQPACLILAKFFTWYADAWRKGDQSCQEPTSAEIQLMGGILTTATEKIRK